MTYTEKVEIFIGALEDYYQQPGAIFMVEGENEVAKDLFLQSIPQGLKDEIVVITDYNSTLEIPNSEKATVVFNSGIGCRFTESEKQIIIASVEFDTCEDFSEEKFIEILKFKEYPQKTIDINMVKNNIASKEFHQPKGTLHIICTLVHKSGFVVIGDCGCTNPAKFNVNIGQDVAYNKAISKLWEMEAFHLQQSFNK